MNGLFFDSGIDKGFERDLDRMNRKLNEFSNNSVKQGNIMDKSFSKLTRVAGGLITAMAVGRAGKELIDFSQKLDISLTEVSTISQEVTDNFDDYRNSIINLSKKGAQGATDLSDALYDIVSAGYDGAQGLKLLEASQQASTAGFVDVGVAADGLTTVLNAWGKSADEAAKVSDTFFKTVEKGKTTFPELASNISQVAPLASSMGISFEEVSGAMATLTKQGTPTAQAFTQIRSAMVAMNEQLGSAFFETHTLQEGFQALLDKSKQTGKTLNEVTGRVEGAMAVLATTGKNAQVAADDLDAMNNAMGATSVAAGKVLASSKQQIGVLKNNILAFLEPLGNQGIKVLGDLAGKLNNVFGNAVIDKIKAERDEVFKLVTKLNDANISEDDRRKILERLKELAPDIVGSIKKEGDNLKIATEELTKYNQQIINRIILAKKEQKIEAFRIKAAEAGKEAEEALAEIQLKRVNAVSKISEKNKFAAEVVLALLDGTITQTTKMSEISEKYGEDVAVLLNQAGINTSRNAKDFVNAQNIAIQRIAKLNGLTADQIGLNNEFFDLVRKFNPLFNEQNEMQFKANELQAEALELAKLLGIELDNNNTKREGETITTTVSTELSEAELEVKLKKLEEFHQEEINLITKKYQEKKINETKLNNDLIDEDLRYYDERLKYTKDNLEKLRLQNEIINKKIEKDKINSSKKTVEQELDQLEIIYQAKINGLTGVYMEEANLLKSQGESITDLQKEYQKDLIQADIDYFKQKLAITTDELEKLTLEYQIAQKEMQLKGTSPEDSNFASSFSQIASEFSNAGDEISNQIAGLSESIISAFDTINSESSSTSDKISGIISLIMAAGELIKDVVTNIYTDEANDQIQINKQLADRIKAETTINRLVRERRELELNQSAFIDANYKDRYNLALQQLSDSEQTINDSLDALSKNFVLTATGHGESWLGINKTAEEYSFTLAQILDQTDTLSGVELGGTISNILDPVDLFGGAASGDAYQDAFKQVKSAFESTLKSMGKTAADMANFSKEEWIDFYTVLDESGYITDQGTKALVDSMREAQEAYLDALEAMRDIIGEIAGSLGEALGDSLVDAIANGTDALDNFKKSLNDVFIEMAKAEVNSLFFQSLFDNLQARMEESMGIGGDQRWDDDLLDFYNQLPGAINNAEQFLRDFDAGLQDLGFAGLTGETDSNLSAGAKIAQQITEQTGSEIVGRAGAIMLSNQILVNQGIDMLDYAVQNLIYMKEIANNTAYLPEIADNTKKTYELLR